VREKSTKAETISIIFKPLFCALHYRAARCYLNL